MNHERQATLAEKPLRSDFTGSSELSSRIFGASPLIKCLLFYYFGPPNAQGLARAEDMATQATLAVLRKRGAAAGVRVPRALNSKSVVDVQRPTWYPYDGTEVASKFRALGNEKADLSDLVKVAVRIQAVFRGFRARKYATKVFHRKVLISKPAFLKVANEIKRLHLGWNHFCIHTVLFALVLCLAYFQFLAYRPSAHSQEYALLRALEDVSTSDGVGFADVSSLAEAKAFVRSMAQIMAHPDPYSVASLQERPSVCDFQSCQGLDLDQLISQCSLVTEYSGFLDQYNRHQVGLVVSQRRREFETCRASFDDSFESIGIYESGPANTSRRCTRTKSSASTFVSDTTDAAPEILQNFSLFGVNPFESDSDNVFTAVVDLGLLNLPQEFMDCALSYLFEDVHWVDQATSELCASVVVQNLNAAGRYGYMQACFRTDVGGLVSPKVVVHSAQQASKGLRAGSVLLACIYALTIFAAGVLFSRKLLRKLHCRIGRWRARSARSLSWLGLGFEVTTLVLHLIVLIRFLQFESSSRQFQPFAGSYATTVLLGVREIVQFVQEVTFTMRIYSMLLIFMVIRTVKHLDFHPDTGIISRTLSRSASDILSFLFVYLVVVLSYAFIGLLMYSPYGEAFGSYFEAVTTLLFVSMGEFDATMDIIFSDSIEGDVWISQIFFWTYVFFTTLVLFNILLSIVVESFVSFQESSRASPTISFLQSMYLSSFITLYDVRNYHIPVAVALAYRICAWCGLSHGNKNTTSVSEPQSLSSQATNHDPPSHRQGGDHMGLSSPTSPEALPKADNRDTMSVFAGSSNGNLSAAGTTTAATAATVAARSSPVTLREEDKVNPLRSSAAVASPISYEDLEALEVRHELDSDPHKKIDFGANDSLGLSLLFHDGVSIEHLTTHPHRYDERLQFLRMHVAGSVPTFALRQELLQAFPESMAERLLWLFRQRTEELRPSDAREEVDMLFSESASQLYIIDQLKQVTNRLDAIAGHQQRRTVRTKEGQSGSISQLYNRDTELTPESSLRSAQ